MNFLNLFPLPNYLRIPAVGVDISDRSIKYVELQKDKKELRLKKFGERKIEAGIVEAGAIKKRKELISHLKVVLGEVGNCHIVSSLPEEKAFLKVVHMPFMEKEKIRPSLELQLEEIVPLPPNEVEFDYEVVGKGAKGNDLVVTITVFPKKIACEYAEVFHESGFVPVAFEVENQAIARALLPQNSKNAVLVADFGRTRTSFLISHDGCIKFTSTISISGENTNKALATVFKVDLFSAERIKQEYSADETADEKILSAVMPTMSAIKDEVRRILDFWENHADGQIKEGGVREIAKIVLCGGDSNLAGFPDFLSRELKKSVELGSPWINVASFEHYVPEMERRESLAYVTAIGLALRSYL